MTDHPLRYRSGCRCDDCRKRWAAYMREYKKRRLLGDKVHLTTKRHDDDIDALLEILHG